MLDVDLGMRHGLDTLLSLAGEQMHREDSYWWKIEAWQVHPSRHIPHGIRYNLTLHNRHNVRIFGIDNAHGIKVPKRGKVSGKRHEYDHQHRHAKDKGVPYEFVSAYQLLQDFFFRDRHHNSANGTYFLRQSNKIKE